MDKIKVGALGIFDEQKFKKLASDREDWLNGGEDMLLNNNFRINKIASELKPNQIVVNVSKIYNENENYKTLLLTAKNGEVLPIFKPGQKISITINIKDKFYTRPYYLISTPNDSLNGEYKITVRNNSKDIMEDYLFNKAKIGERFSISSPFGEFYYNKIRDCRNVIAIVNSDGIMPIYSMIQSIIEGSLDCNLTVFYNEKTKNDLLYVNELNDSVNKSANIKVNYVLIEEEAKGFLHGYVSIDKINNVFVEGNTSIFISGNEGLLKYQNNELESLKLPKKYVVYDDFFPVCNIKRVVKYKLSIYVNNEKYEVPCYNNKTIMQALMDGGVYIPSKCHNGSCGYCRSELVLGEVKIINDKRSSTDKKYNYIHPCSTYPLSDIEIIVR